MYFIEVYGKFVFCDYWLTEFLDTMVIMLPNNTITNLECIVDTFWIELIIGFKCYKRIIYIANGSQQVSHMAE